MVIMCYLWGTGRGEGVGGWWEGVFRFWNAESELSVRVEVQIEGAQSHLQLIFLLNKTVHTVLVITV